MKIYNVFDSSKKQKCPVCGTADPTEVVRVMKIPKGKRRKKKKRKYVQVHLNCLHLGILDKLICQIIDNEKGDTKK